MGQYQQWLNYREIDQALQAHIETLEQELVHLQERARVLEQSIQSSCEDATAEVSQRTQQVLPLTNNQLMRALLLNMNGQLAANGKSPLQNANPQPLPTPPSKAEEKGTIETVSTALFARTNLPTFGPQAVPDEPQTSFNGSTQEVANGRQSLPSTPHSEMVLLPEDIGTFIDQHALTDPQLELPRWLRNFTTTAANQHPDGPVDQESIRTNRLVQRWVERWGKQTEHQQKAGDSQS